MSETNWSPAETERALQLWAEYQQQHDLTARLGQTAGIDPVSGRVWFGKSAKEIALVLSLSARTIEDHKYRLMDSLGIENGAELIHFAIKHGLVP